MVALVPSWSKPDRRGAALHLGQQTAADPEPREQRVHEDGGDARGLAVVAIDMPGGGADQLAVHESPVHLLGKQAVAVGG